MTSMIEKVAALLALAENNDNEHEAELAMQQAQRLATMHAVDLAVARQHTAKKEKREEIEARVVQIGHHGDRGNKTRIDLFLTIAGENDVRCTIAGNHTAVYPMGFPSDLDVVEAMFNSLAVQMTAAGNAYLKSGEYKKELVERRVAKRRTDEWGDSWTDYVWETKPLDGRTARANFNKGFIRKIWHRLSDARQEAVKAAEEINLTVDDEETGEVQETTGALVLASKSVAVQDAHADRCRVGKVRSSYRGASTSVSSYGSRRAGERAGADARLSGQQAIGGGPKEVTG